MAILTTKQRDKLPKKDFGLPEEEKYPINDRKRAINAKSRSTQMYNAGKISKAKMDKIHSKANRFLYDKGKERDLKMKNRRKKST